VLIPLTTQTWSEAHFVVPHGPPKVAFAVGEAVGHALQTQIGQSESVGC
jgi:hypothetical protein